LKEGLAELAQANRDEYDAVILMYLEELTEREAAQIIGISAATLHERKQRGLRFLRDYLSKE
jgi:DNA-directed RNA polymerase specialized sigma24 family protein